MQQEKTPELIIIENNGYVLTVSTKGAEIKSFTNREGREAFRNPEKDPSWGGIAPNLFPLTGPPPIKRTRKDPATGKDITEGFYRLDGKEYQINQHGFIREKIAETEQQSETGITLVIKSDADTKKSYPYDFEYRVRYELSRKGLLEKSVIIKNTGDKPMPFNMGDHEGYVLEKDINNYYLRFNAPEEANAEVNGKKVIKTKDKHSILELNEDLFVNNHLEIDGLKASHATLLEKDSDGTRRGVATFTIDSPVFLLWSKPPYKFICPEPWHGAIMSEAEGKDTQFKNILPPGEEFRQDRIIYNHNRQGSKQKEKAPTR